MNEYDHGTIEPIEPIEPTERWEPAETLSRPRWPKVIGIISIIWGSLGMVCGGLGLVILPFSPKLSGLALQNGEPTPYGNIPTITDYSIAAIGLCLAVLLLFAGIACVSHRPVTRRMHLAYGLLSIPVVVWSYLNQQGKLALNLQWAKEYPDNPLAQGFNGQAPGAAIGQTVGLVVLIVLGFGIPLFYLVWFGLVKTRPEQVTGGDEGVY